MAFFRIKSTLAVLSLSTLLSFASSSIAGTLLSPTHKQQSAQQTKTTRISKKVKSIAVNGDMQLLVLGSPKLKHPQLVMNPYSAPGVNYKVQNSTLYINAPKQRLELGRRPKVVLRVPELNNLQVDGAASVTAKHIISQGLVLDANGSGTVDILGIVNVKVINQNDNNLVNIRWVNSKDLTINARGFGYLRLAGVVNTLYAHVFDSATLQAKYLRVQDAWVQVADNSRAFVTPIDALRAFAKQDANVYYYKYPKHITRNSVNSGNILQMGWHN